MKLIAAVDNEWGIGKDNKLLVHIPEDMTYFKARTLSAKVVIMGRKTLESLPNSQPLENRINIVLSREKREDFTPTDVSNKRTILLWENDLKSTLKTLKVVSKILNYDVFSSAVVIGGSNIYEQFLPYCELAYITHINKTFPEANVFFPKNYLLNNFSLKEKTETFTSKKEGIEFAFAVYKNNKKVDFNLE